jgi:hypothetical protein
MVGDMGVPRTGHAGQEVLEGLHVKGYLVTMIRKNINQQVLKNKST